TYCVEHAKLAYQAQIRRGSRDGATELARSLRRYI
ncbi:MAG: GcrA cell cycle regulator, partial [Brevundimonas sp.]